MRKPKRLYFKRVYCPVKVRMYIDIRPLLKAMEAIRQACEQLVQAMATLARGLPFRDLPSLEI